MHAIRKIASLGYSIELDPTKFPKGSTTEESQLSDSGYWWG